MRHRALQNESTRTPVATTSGRATTAAPPKATASGTASTATGTASGPMDLSANRPKLTAEKRARQMAEERYYKY